MLRSKFVKTFSVGLCLTAFLSSSVFANTVDSKEAFIQSREIADDPVVMIYHPADYIVDNGARDLPVFSDDLIKWYGEEILNKQREIDQKVFGSKASEIAQKGFKVTHTGPNQGYVEIGIMPYSNENAKYLYNIFGDKIVRVVEGIQAEILPFAAHNNEVSGATSGSSAANSTTTGTVTGNSAGEVLSPDISALKEPLLINEDILKKQQEIDKYLFETNASDIEKKNFKVTHTGPNEDYVEIGIIPYSKENAEYLHNIFGDEMVRVVEGMQAEIFTLRSSADSAEFIATNVKDMTANAPNRGSSTLLYSAFAVAASLLLGMYVFIRRKMKPSSN